MAEKTQNVLIAIPFVLFVALVLSFPYTILRSEYVEYQCQRLGYDSGRVLWPGVRPHCREYSAKLWRTVVTPLGEAQAH